MPESSVARVALRVKSVDWRVVAAFIRNPIRVGNDGLTDAERMARLRWYEEGVGRTPEATPERRQRLARLPVRRPSCSADDMCNYCRRFGVGRCEENL